MSIIKSIITYVATTAFSMSILAQPILPYQDKRLSATLRADDLLKRLTIEEKVALMQNNSVAIERLGIKPYEWWNEALHGVARAGYATVYPQAIGLAATFNSELAFRMFDEISDEARQKHDYFAAHNSYKRYQGLTFWTPNINIFRDPRWGRGQETYGEDPYLTGQIGLAAVNGLQNVDANGRMKTHACAKHFAVHSGPEWCRHSFDAHDITTRDLRETYLPAFQVLVEKGHVREVMCAYNRYEGEPCCGSERLLTRILRNEWGFDGIVTTDCWAMRDFWETKAHATHTSAKQATADAVLSGTDLECGSSFKELVEAAKAGLIDEHSIDISVRRLLTARFELGLMDEENITAPFEDPKMAATPQHAQTALRVAEESIVLLQNRSNTLPLNTGMRIAIVGPNADNETMQWGNYNGQPTATSTLLSAMQEIMPQKQLTYYPLCSLTDEKVSNSIWGGFYNGGESGIKGYYWKGNKMDGKPVTTKNYKNPIFFDTHGATQVANGVGTNNFIAKYSGSISTGHNAKVKVRVTHNGIFELHINGKKIASAKALKKSTDVAEYTFEKGKTYDVEFTFVAVEENNDFAIDFVEVDDTPWKKIASDLKKSDVIIFCGGLSPRLEGEEMRVNAEGFKGGDRTDIQLPKAQRQAIAKLATLGKPLVFVNYSGSAVALCEEADNCNAVVQAWYPGQEGGTAVANVLMGKYNPSGRLPLTFYKSTEQLPDFLDYSMKGRTYRYMTEKPLFCFGHGLSYTTFEMRNARFAEEKLCYGSTAHLTIDVTNTGDMDGEEVIEIYIRRPDDKEGPNKTLRAFKKAFIAKGETKSVTIDMPYESFQWFDEAQGKMRVLSGTYEILYGSTSDDEMLKKITIEAE